MATCTPWVSHIKIGIHARCVAASAYNKNVCQIIITIFHIVHTILCGI